jgi:hypothetical protein
MGKKSQVFPKQDAKPAQERGQTWPLCSRMDASLLKAGRQLFPSSVLEIKLLQRVPHKTSL